MATATVQPELKVETVDVIEVFADPEFNCRGFIAPIHVTDLAKSMQDRGLQQPITVQPWAKKPGKKWRVVSGHRRHRAAEILNWVTIPAIVREDLTEEDALDLNLIENLQREDLNMMQEARAIERYVKSGVTQVDIANRVKKSRGWVQVRIALLTLPKEIQEEAQVGMLTIQQIRDIADEPSKERQFELVRMVKDRKLKGETTPRLKKMNKNPFLKKKRERDEMFEMIEHISKAIGFSLATRCLAWAAGEINDLELYSDVAKVALEKGIDYKMPGVAS